MEPPQYPVGPYVDEDSYGAERRRALIDEIEQAPARLRQAVEGLSAARLDTRYKNWTIRQIVHHLADSHVNSYIRFKWTLTEERPTIKAYEEGLWSDLADARTGDIREPLALLDGLHARWVQLMRCMTDEQFRRSFYHPQSKTWVSLLAALSQYAWHGRHHTGQILWLREQKFATARAET